MVSTDGKFTPDDCNFWIVIMYKIWGKFGYPMETGKLPYNIATFDLSEARTQFNIRVSTGVLSLNLWIFFLVFTFKVRKQSWGFVHLYLTLLYLCQMAMPILSFLILKNMAKYNDFWDRYFKEPDIKKKIAMNAERIALDKYVNNLVYVDISYSQLAKTCLMLLIQLFILRFKRVELQVTQDQFATTYHIFKKIIFNRRYYMFFIISVLVYQFALLGYFCYLAWGDSIDSDTDYPP